MLMPVNHLLGTIETVPIISPIKNKISPEKKTQLHKHGAQDPKETTSSGEELDSEHELEFTPN